MTQVTSRSAIERFKQSPYYDDYSDNSLFHRILFKPGVGIQARELTQAQTILQAQIERFGSHIFKDGSKVVGGDVAIQTCEFVRVRSLVTVDSVEYTFNPTEWLNKTIAVAGNTDLTEYNPAWRGKVVHIDTDVNAEDPYYVIFFQTVSGSSSVVSTDTNLIIVDWTDTSSSPPVAQTSNVGANDKGDAHVVTVTPGIYFISGFFVMVEQQSIAAKAFVPSNIRIFEVTSSSGPSTRIGLSADYQTITSSQDISLLDPAKGLSNAKAPGADRLKIVLTLSQYPYDGDSPITNSTLTNIDGKDFIELVRFENGSIVSQVKYPVYSDIERTLARRTYDESGSYTVRPFQLQMKNKDSSTLQANLNGGKAYIYGFEFENIGTSRVDIPKATETQTFTNVNIYNNAGNYCYLKQGNALTGFTLSDLDNLVGKGLDVDLYDRSSTKIGTAKIKYLTLDDYADNEFRATISDVTMDPNEKFEDTSSMKYGTGPTDFLFIARFEINLVDNYVYGKDFTVGQTVYFRDSVATNVYTAVVDEWIPSSPGAPGSKLYVKEIVDPLNLNNPNLVGLSGAFEVTDGADISYSIVDASQRAYVELPEQNSSIIPIPYGNRVKKVTSLEYNTVKTFSGTSDGSGNLTLSTGSPIVRFMGGTSVTNDEKKYYLLFENDSSSFNHFPTDSTGLTISTNNISAPLANGSATITDLTPSTDYVVFAVCSVVDDADINDDFTFYRKKVEQIVTSESVTIASGVGTLDNADIIEIVSIIDGATDITNRFTLDNGQRQDFYLRGTIKLKPGQTSSSTVSVTYKYYQHTDPSGSTTLTDLAGPFVAQSYPSSPTVDPYFISPKSGESIDLRDTIDFRPVITTDTVSVDGLTPEITYPQGWFYNDAETAQASFEVYLSRIDKLILTKDRQFAVISGVPDINPKEPRDSDEGMTLYVIRLNANTKNEKDLAIKYIDQQNYTMSDIRKLDNRITRVESLASLSALEQKAEAFDAVDSNGLSRFKTGILVDSFNGHSVGNVADPDYNCAIDFTNRELRPPFESKQFGVGFAQIQANDKLEVTPDGLLILKQKDPLAVITQPLASKSLNVNPYNVTSWLGTMDLSPSTDNWLDQTRTPDVIVNIDGSNDAWEAIARTVGPWGTQWGDWQDTWTGRQITESSFTEINRVSGGVRVDTINRTITNVSTNQTREGTQNVLSTETISQRLGDRVVSSSILPYIRSNTITAVCNGLKPNRRLYAFFDDVNVTSNCVCKFESVVLAGSASSTLVLSIAGTTTSSLTVGDIVTAVIDGNTYSSGTISDINEQENKITVIGGTGYSISGSDIGRPATLTFTQKLFTDSTGSVEVDFTIPSGTFRTGERVFRLIDESSNDTANSTTMAEARYFAQGLLQSVENTTISTRVPTVTRISIDDSRITNNVFVDDVVAASRFVRYSDPLAETFLVDGTIHPNGYFIHSVDLFFRTKDANLPVTVQIRPTINGYPSSSIVLAEATRQSADVVTSENPNSSSDFTRFQFSSPTHLPPGEYAFVVLSNSNAYEAWAAGIGETIVGSSAKVTAQPYAGSLFLSQNGSTWSPDQTTDLMFIINRSVFSTTEIGDTADTFTAEFEVATSGNETADLVMLQTQDAIPSGCRTSYKIGFAGATSYINISPNSDTQLDNRTNIQNGSDVTTIKVQLVPETSGTVTPIVDTQRLGLIAVKNTVTGTLSSPEQAIEEDVAVDDATQQENVARYITRVVELEEEYQSNGIRVILDANLPPGAGIEVYARLVPNGVADYNTVGYTRIPLDGSFRFTDNPSDFREYTFVKDFDPITLAEQFEFNRYQVKIIMTATNTPDVPRIKNLRIISLI